MFSEFATELELLMITCERAANNGREQISSQNCISVNQKPLNVKVTS